MPPRGGELKLVVGPAIGVGVDEDLHHLLLVEGVVVVFEGRVEVGVLDLEGHVELLLVPGQTSPGRLPGPSPPVGSHQVEHGRVAPDGIVQPPVDPRGGLGMGGTNQGHGERPASQGNRGEADAVRPVVGGSPVDGQTPAQPIEPDVEDEGRGGKARRHLQALGVRVDRARPPA